VCFNATKTLRRLRSIAMHFFAALLSLFTQHLNQCSSHLIATLGLAVTDILAIPFE
jgi:hypothetical protein